MARPTYGDEVKEAAKTLHIEGLSSPEIRDRLANGNAGLPYKIQPSERTIDGWRRRWKREGIRAASIVRAGDEESAENAIYRRLLGIYRQALAKLEDQEISGNVDSALPGRIRTYQATVDAARAKRAIVSKRERGQTLTANQASELGQGEQQKTPALMLDRLAALEADRETGQTEPTTSKGIKETTEADSTKAFSSRPN